jgi:PKD repeat protein
VNGTSATSVNPQVFFHNTGTYSIQQIVSNWNGSDTITQSAAVTVSAGQAAGFTETFDSFTNCGTATNCAIVCNLSNGWRNDNNDNTDWRTNSGSTPSTGTGPTSDHTGNNGKYLYLEATSCFNSPALLYSPCVDLSGITSGQLSFWYHMNGTDVGEIHLDIMSDGLLIQDITPALYGSQGNQWLQRLVDLTPYLGTQVQFIFRGVTGPDFASDIAIDDISIFNNDPAPAADFAVATPAGSCTNDTLVFSDNSTGLVGSYLWNFGAGAVPANSTAAGPHQVYYTYPGTKSVSLLVQNGGGANTFVQNVQIDAYASAAFSFSWTGAGGTYNFILSNPAGMTGVTWYFGDGTTSTQNNPSHTYSANGNYAVSCAVMSDCGLDSTSVTISVFGVGIGIEEASWEGLALYPNPAVDKLFIRLPEGMPHAEVQIMDMSGRSIGAPIALQEREQTIDLTGLSAGSYLFQFTSEKGTKTERVVIR